MRFSVCLRCKKLAFWLKLPKSLFSSVSAPSPFFKMALPMKVMKAMKAMKAATSMKAKVMKKKAVSKIARGQGVFSRGFVWFMNLGFCWGFDDLGVDEVGEIWFQ